MTTNITAPEAVALDKLSQVAKTEQAIERAFQPIADSLMVSGKKGVEDYLKKLKDDIKAFLSESTEPFLYDGELEWSAKLQPRSGTPTLDLLSMAKNEPGMLLELAQMGCLKVDWATFKTNFGKSAAVDDARHRYSMPGTATFALLIGPAK